MTMWFFVYFKYLKGWGFLIDYNEKWKEINGYEKRIVSGGLEERVVGAINLYYFGKHSLKNSINYLKLILLKMGLILYFISLSNLSSCD